MHWQNPSSADACLIELSPPMISAPVSSLSSVTLEMDFALFGFRLYFAIAILGLAVPGVWFWSHLPETYYKKDAANDFSWLTEDERARLNHHLNREKITWDFWRRMIRG